MSHILPKYFHEWKNYDYVGSIAWKFREKQLHFNGVDMFIYPDYFTELMLRIDAKNVDLISFIHQRPHTLIEQAKICHPKFQLMWQPLLASFGFTDHQILKCSTEPFYANYWIAKTAMVKQFSQFVGDVQLRMTTLQSIQNILWSDSTYKTTGNLSVDTNLKSIFNRSYYTYHPFILERLAPFFFQCVINAKEQKSVELITASKSNAFKTRSIKTKLKETNCLRKFNGRLS